MKFSSALTLFTGALLATSPALASPAGLDSSAGLEKRASNCIIQRGASCNWGPGPTPSDFRHKHQFNGKENIQLECYLTRDNGGPKDDKYWYWVPKWGCYVNRSYFKGSCTRNLGPCPWGKN